MLSGGR
jgi:hypothetical protein